MSACSRRFVNSFSFQLILKMKSLLWIWVLLCLLTGRGSLSEGKPPIKLNAIKGEKVTFTFQLPDKFKIRDIYWYFDSTVIATVEPGKPISLRAVKQFKGRLDDIHQNGSLQISNLTMEDRGLYKAEISPSEDDKYINLHNYTLNILKRVTKPHIAVTADSVNGTCNITVNCTVQEGGADVNYTWRGGNITQSVGPILYLSWTNSSKHLTVDCTANNPVSNKSASVQPWESCKQESQNPAAVNTGLNVGIVFAVIIIVLVLSCAGAVVARRMKRKKMQVSRNEVQTMYSQINNPSNTTQGNNQYTRSKETNAVTTVYATVNPRKRESPAINDCAPEENTEKTVYTVVQIPKNKSDIILYETVSNEPSQSTSYNEVI